MYTSFLLQIFVIVLVLCTLFISVMILHLMLKGLEKRRNDDLIGLAVDTIFEFLEDSVIILNENRKIAGYNHAATRIFPDIFRYERIESIRQFPMFLLETEYVGGIAIGTKCYEGHTKILRDEEQKVKGYVIRMAETTQIKPLEPMTLQYEVSSNILENRVQYLNEEDLIKLFMADVNVISAVERQGSVEDYLELLDLFYTDGIQRVDLLEELVEKQDMEHYVIEVHGLKSAAANIGADKLSKLAEKQEKSGESLNLMEVKKNTNLLSSYYHKVLGEIKRVLEQQEYGQFVPRENKNLGQMGERDMLVQLKGILEHLKNFQSKEAAHKVEELLSCGVPEQIKSKLEQLQVLLKMYEDDKAEELLESLIHGYQNS